MENFKPLLKSKTFWLAVISFLTGLPHIGEHVGLVEPQLLADGAGVTLDAISALSAVAIAYTRAKSKKQISGIIKTQPTN